MEGSRLTKYICFVAVFFFGMRHLPLALALEPVKKKEIVEAVSVCMEQVRQRVPDSCGRIDAIRKKYGLAVLPFVEKYMGDPDERVRWQSYMSMLLLGLDSNDLPARRAIVEKLSIAMREDANNSDLARRLLRFEAADFSNKAKELVRQQFHEAIEGKLKYDWRNVILLVGVADLKSELPKLKQIIDEKSDELKRNRAQEVEELKANYRGHEEELWRDRMVLGLETQWWQGTLVWAALRARARMGVKEDIAQCIEMVKSHPDEDTRVTRLLEGLAYVRQPEVVEYLRGYLMSDKMEKSRGNDVPRGGYGAYAAVALAEMLRGFPDKGRAPVEKCRKWMAEQKQLDIIR